MCAGELLEAFIKKYVQCYSCGNPETVIKVGGVVS
jgi:translation initiation factor 5